MYYTIKAKNYPIQGTSYASSTKEQLENNLKRYLERYPNEEYEIIEVEGTPSWFACMTLY